MTATHQPMAVACGAVIDVALNRLKRSPRNARTTPHTEAAIAALAASIAAKGVLQAPVVELELDAGGEPTGCYLVTIGEGRRQALALLTKRKQLRKSDLVRCVLDISNDPHEISLDENVTRSAMHPADQFEAFKRLADERGLSAEEIGARFGVSAHVVRQRLRLGAVSPKLMALYRAEELTLEQLMAFAVSEDHARQEEVLDQLTWNRSAHIIRRAMTETKVAAGDRRAVFVGLEAYLAAGGTILRDLFTEDGGGWFENAGLLDRLTLDALAALAESLRAREGWRWAEAGLDYPHAHGLARVYPQPAPRTADEAAAMAALAEEYDGLVSDWDAAEDLPSEIAARFKEIDAALAAFGDTHAYAADDVARSGLFVVLGHDGRPRIERGFVRPQDAPAPAPEDDAEARGGDGEVAAGAAGQEPAEDAEAPLSERLVLDLTAHRTQGLRDALAAQPTVALVAVTHALALAAFYPPYERATCLDLKSVSIPLEGHAPGVAEGPAGRRIAERHEAWAARLPSDVQDAWGFVSGLGSGDLLDLLAHCASLSVNAVRSPLDRRPGAWAHADALAGALDLDMTTCWTATAQSYFGRVTKVRIAEAVGEAVSTEAAERIAGLKKPDMAQAAQELVAGRGWLPPLLRRGDEKGVGEGEPAQDEAAADIAA